MSASQQQSVANQLQILNDKFAATLTQYQTTFADYNALLTSRSMAEASAVDMSGATTTSTASMGATIAGKADLYAVIPNSTYWGQQGLNEGTAHTAAECLADCYTKPACSGATFDAEKNYCWSRTGDGRIAPGSANQTAIIKKSILYTYQLQELHTKLRDINDKIVALIAANSDTFRQNAAMQQQQSEMVAKNRQVLQEKEMELEILHREQTTLEDISANSALLTNQNYWRYLLWLFACIVVGIFLVKVLFLPDASASQSQYGGSGHRGGSAHLFSPEGLMSLGLGMVTQTVETLGDLAAG